MAGGIAFAQAQGRNQLWYQAYDAGVRDVGRKACDSAVQNLQAAKQSGPQPNRRVIFYGDRVDAFNPDYYLGVAYLNLRRFADADAAFERVKQANLIATNDSLNRAFQTQSSTAKFELVLGRAEDYLAKGDLAQAKQANDQAMTLGTDLKADLTRVTTLQQKLADATARIAGRGQAPAPPAPAPNPVPATPIVAENPPAPLPVAVPAPQPPIAPTPPAVVQGPVTPTPRPNPPPAPRIVQTAPVPVLPPTVALQTGIFAYLEGRYRDAVTALAQTVSDPRASARARFYLACSRAALVLSGDSDETELANAKADLQLAGRPDQFVADRRVISPRVLAALGVQP